MFDWEYKPAEHFLYGTVVVRVLERNTGRPMQGIIVGVADTLRRALRKG